MSKKIKLLKNNDNIDRQDIEWLNVFYNYLTNDLKLNKKKAYQIVYYLQEHLPVFPDHIEQCDVCCELYDSYSAGHYSELTGKSYCSESCEPPGLYEREERAAKRADAPFQRWLRQLKKEQKHYPALKGKEINEGHLRKYFDNKMSPIEALNDIISLI